MIKTTIKISAIAAFMLACGFNASAQTSTTVDAHATIVAPLSIHKTWDLNFGNIATGSTGGTVTLSSTGISATTTDVSFPGTPSFVMATFIVNGDDAFAYTVSFPTSSIFITSSSSSAQMTVNNFQAYAASALGNFTGGSQIIGVGADLIVAGSQLAGQYDNFGGFTVAVNYN